MKSHLNHKRLEIYLIPLLFLCMYFTYSALSFNLHDFSNSVFAADVVKSEVAAEKIIFDMYDFNSYIWKKGYPEVFADFYINSPFNAFLFYPFTFLKEAYQAKLLFNLISCILFLIALFQLAKRELKEYKWIVLLIPILFYVPIRNQILFGQSYFLVFALVIFFYLSIIKNKENVGALSLSLGILVKIFPMFYVAPLFFSWKPKIIIKTVLFCICLLLISSFIIGFDFWKTYLLEVIPNTILNKSTTNFLYQAQSIDVFLKNLFIYDAYYNPTAIFNAPKLYIILKLISKTLIIGIAITASLKNKHNLFGLFAIWIVTLFLIQSSTASYTQIFWIFPMFYVLKHEKNDYIKYGFVFLLLLLCNIPFNKFDSIFLKFSRLWFTILAAIVFFFSLKTTIRLKIIGIVFIVLFSLQLPNLFSRSKETKSDYVLNKYEYFLIYDYRVTNEKIQYAAIGSNGEERINTDIKVTKVDSVNCVLKHNQIYYKEKQLTFDYSLKKKPLLINDTSVYYLTDSNARRGAFTLKKIELK